MNTEMWTRTVFFRGFFAAAIIVVLQGCTYVETSNPLVRKLSWFSYLNGDDIRSACHVGGPEHWRFVYNGIYKEQIRTYDLKERPDGTFLLRANVANTPNLTTLSVKQLSDWVAPWRGKIRTVALGRDQRDLLAQASEASGQFRPPTKGLQLSSDHFYWLGVVCRAGQVSFNAYRWPSAEFQAATFPRLLLAWDPTGEPLNPPRETSPYAGHDAKNPQHQFQFNLEVGTEGLLGVKPLF